MKFLKYIALSATSVIIIIILSKILKFEDDSAFEVIATFLSITTGFTITALSIIATSPFSRHLHSIQSENDNSRTLLHILIDKFKNSTILFISCIALIIIYNFSLSKDTGCDFRLYTLVLNTKNLFQSTICLLTICSFIAFINLFKTFAQFVIKTSTS